MNLYKIKNWDEQFENNRTRNMKHMQWVPVPNKHDGDGYTELVDRENGAEMLGAWMAILQVASKCGERGTLVRDNGTPHTAKTIARLTRLKEGSISKALDLLCHPEIDWLQVVDDEQVAGGCQIPAVMAHPTDEEGKGRKEEKGTEERVASPKKKSDAITKILDALPEDRKVLFELWLKYKTEKRQSYKPTGLTGLIKKWDSSSVKDLESAVEHSIASNYDGLYAPKIGYKKPQTNRGF